MKAVTVQFDQSGSRYERLLDVLIASWNANTSIPLQVLRIPAPKTGLRNDAFYYNHAKLRKWIDSVDQDTIFIDCDMLCLRDISDGFDNVQHIGVTVRPGDYPMNCGVVFVRHNPKTMAFLEKWYEIDAQMLADEGFHMKWYKKVAGMNQSSMKWMIDNGYGDMVSTLPCTTYNLCDGQWDQWQQAKMIHIKGYLREYIMGGRPPKEFISESYKQIKSVWQSYFPIQK